MPKAFSYKWENTRLDLLGLAPHTTRPMEPSPSLKPLFWGGPTWRALAGIAHGMADQHGEEPVSEYTVQLFSALGGLLPCSACRDTYYQMVIDVLEPPHPKPPSAPSTAPRAEAAAYARPRAEALMAQLACADMPKFVFELHEKVNDKLDSAHFSRRLSGLASRLSIEEPELVKALQATRFCRGRRPTLGDVHSVHLLHTFKCTPEDAMSMLFMFAYSLPPPSSRAKTDDPDVQRHVDFYTFMGALPEVMAESGGDSTFLDTLSHTLEAFESGGGQAPGKDGRVGGEGMTSRDHATLKESDYSTPSRGGVWNASDTLYRDPVIDTVMKRVLSAKRTGVFTSHNAFMLAWVVRARLARGFKSALKEHAMDDAIRLYTRIHAASQR